MTFSNAEWQAIRAAEDDWHTGQGELMTRLQQTDRRLYAEAMRRVGYDTASHAALLGLDR